MISNFLYKKEKVYRCFISLLRSIMENSEHNYQNYIHNFASASVEDLSR